MSDYPMLISNKLHSFRNFMLQDYYLREYENYFINDSWMEAREQYESLLKTRPDLILKLPLKHIASYLQITPQSLSRIRASVKK